MSLIEWSRSTLIQGQLAFGGHQLLQGSQSCFIDSQYYLFYFYVTFRKDIDSMESHVLFIVSYCHLMIVGIQGK